MSIILEIRNIYQKSKNHNNSQRQNIKALESDASGTPPGKK